MEWCLTWKSSALQLKFRGSPLHSPSVIRDEQLKSPECSMKWFWRAAQHQTPRAQLQQPPEGPCSTGRYANTYQAWKDATKSHRFLHNWPLIFAAWDAPQVIFSKHSNKKPLVKSDFPPYSLSYLSSLPPATPMHFRDLYGTDLSLNDQREYVMQSTWSVP